MYPNSESFGQIFKCGVAEQEKILLERFEFIQISEELESYTREWINQQNKLSNRENYTLNLVVHIVYRADEENISDDQIESQIQVLNKDFQALNEDYNHELYFGFNKGNAQIDFRLATTDPVGNFTNGITRTFTQEVNIGEQKDANGRAYIKHSDLGGVDAWPEEDYINVWLGNRTVTFGEGSRPGLSLEGEDGLVLDPTYFGTSGSALENEPHHLGRTCTHEMGHYLNLIHPWGSVQSCASDDLVDDTPIQHSPYYMCGEAKFLCGEREMVHNFMDYVEDDCMFYFTKGQVRRMWACLEGPRNGLIMNQNELPQEVFPDGKPYWLRFIPELEEVQLYLTGELELDDLNIYNIEGKLLYSDSGNLQSYIKIDTRQWESGPYIVCLQSGQNRWTEKLIKY